MLNNNSAQHPVVSKDEDGLYWTEFTTDHFAEQRQGVCSICDREIGVGWLCGGEEVCRTHMKVSPTGELIVTTRVRLGK